MSCCGKAIKMTTERVVVTRPLTIDRERVRLRPIGTKQVSTRSDVVKSDVDKHRG